MAYWQFKNDWLSVCNVYAALLRAIETGKHDWSIDPNIFKDMPNKRSQQHTKGRTLSDRQEKAERDVVLLCLSEGGTAPWTAPTWTMWALSGL